MVITAGKSWGLISFHAPILGYDFDSDVILEDVGSRRWVQTLTEVPLKSDIYRNPRKPIPVMLSRCVSMDIYGSLVTPTGCTIRSITDTCGQWRYFRYWPITLARQSISFPLTQRNNHPSPGLGSTCDWLHLMLRTLYLIPHPARERKSSRIIREHHSHRLWLSSSKLTSSYAKDMFHIWVTQSGTYSKLTMCTLLSQHNVPIWFQIHSIAVGKTFHRYIYQFQDDQEVGIPWKL